MTMKEYRAMEEEFMARKDALCENVIPANCNCSECPCKEQCDQLEVAESELFQKKGNEDYE